MLWYPAWKTKEKEEQKHKGINDWWGAYSKTSRRIRSSKITGDSIILDSKMIQLFQSEVDKPKTLSYNFFLSNLDHKSRFGNNLREILRETTLRYFLTRLFCMACPEKNPSWIIWTKAACNYGIMVKRIGT